MLYTIYYVLHTTYHIPHTTYYILHTIILLIISQWYPLLPRTDMPNQPYYHPLLSLTGIHYYPLLTKILDHAL